MSKKVLNSFKIAVFFASTVLFAQNSSEKSQDSLVMPSMPTMPSISKPSIGSGFYMPGRSDFYSGISQSQKKSQAKTSQDSTSATQPGSQESSQTSVSETVETQTQKLSTLAKSASTSFNQLTADDISSMNSLGVLNSLSSLLGRGATTSQNQLLTGNTITANTVDSVTLRQILSELTELKKQISSGENTSKTGTETSLNDRSNGENAFSNKIKNDSKILRFTVNGYDILSTCKKIYFSEIETDGTFLLTGDRKYMSEGKVRNETFYFYFHARGTENGITKYTVTPAVSQDFENQYSYLYQLTQKNVLTADRTGNLITLRESDGSWKMDLLISLDR